MSSIKPAANIKFLQPSLTSQQEVNENNTTADSGFLLVENSYFGSLIGFTMILNVCRPTLVGSARQLLKLESARKVDTQRQVTFMMFGNLAQSSAKS